MRSLFIHDTTGLTEQPLVRGRARRCRKQVKRKMPQHRESLLITNLPRQRVDTFWSRWLLRIHRQLVKLLIAVEAVVCIKSRHLLAWRHPLVRWDVAVALFRFVVHPLDGLVDLPEPMWLISPLPLEPSSTLVRMEEDCHHVGRRVVSQCVVVIELLPP